MTAPVLIAAPTGGDAPAIGRVLDRMRLACRICRTVHDMAQATDVHSTPLLILAEEALVDGIDGLKEVLLAQPAWSDLPILLLAVGDRRRGTARRWSLFEQLGNATVLERPLQVGVIEAAVRSALRARDRQYLARGHLLELEHGRSALEAEVEERTRSLREEAAERRRAEEALARAQRLDAIGKLTGGVAHDFNNLLQVILGGLEMVDRHPPGSPRHEAVLSAMRQAAGRGAKLTEQLLAFARRQPLSPERIDVGAQIGEMEDLLRGALKSGVELRMRIAPDLWPVSVDTTQLEVAVLNLVINARDAIDGDGQIVVSIDNHHSHSDSGAPEADGEMVRITVRDTGCGMPPDVKERAFEPFFTTKVAGRGTGLGLSQVYGFVKQSNGTLHIDSAPEAGTAICFFLPRTHQIEAAVVAPTRSNAASDGVVLVVDDEPRIAEFACEMLRALGYECEHVASADAALKEDLSRFAAVLSDVIMHGSMDGVALAEELRRRRPGLPIILATGFASPERLSGTGLPILRKPYRQKDLGRVLTAALGSRTASD